MVLMARQALERWAPLSENAAAKGPHREEQQFTAAEAWPPAGRLGAAALRVARQPAGLGLGLTVALVHLKIEGDIAQTPISQAA